MLYSYFWSTKLQFMRKSFFKFLGIIGIAVIAMSFSSNDGITNIQPSSNMASSKEAAKAQTYKIRYGLLSQSGVKVLSGSYDVGSFVATNTATGETYETYAGSGLQSLPKYYEGIPAGEYTFTAMQGQGGWVGYGSVTGTVSDAEVDEDGYITIYIPIVWEE